MDLQDQASSLRGKVNDIAEPPLQSHEVDIMNLPPRSVKHLRSRAQQKKTISQGKLHLWITRGIVISFLCMIFFIVYYLSSDMNMDQEMKKGTVRLINIIK
ncbi:hypothetical protein [Pseudalkalibacillus salsuginis]|uniref:hypothetical protein n=1 Tax=Pseudalkalibacillus salsuginis TaxID=2910972 RepID=UPI001F3C7246|nr:hypothetical protein [Pseudalkalibacillus salsuginis]MCF6408262.1 hypothetical protein [Pseudalkalibacillus salsuginis]